MTFEHQNHTSVVATRHYRAPEVILGEPETLFGGLESNNERTENKSILLNLKPFLYLLFMFLNRTWMELPL